LSQADLQMPPFVFTCPTTQAKVQDWSDGDDTPADQYDAVVCKACGALHFVNRKTGKVMGEREE
jgi:hypothetical protein